MTLQTTLITPYRGDLVDLIVPAAEHKKVFEYASSLPSLQLTLRQACDLELLATGGFSPLSGFMNRADYESVVANMRLADGTVFPVPVSLSVDRDDYVPGSSIALRDVHNDILAVMTIEEIYEWDQVQFVNKVLGTDDVRHPLVAESAGWGRYNISGPIRVLGLSRRFDNQDLRLTPRETRERLQKMGRPHVVAFQTRNPIHFAHETMTKRAMESVDGTLLLHPVVGMTKEGDIDHFTRVRSYRALAAGAYDKNSVLLSLLPLAMRMAGPREAVWHAIIRRNYGASHFIVGRDHASPGVDSNGKPFYRPTEAQELASSVSGEIGMDILSFQEFVYLADEERYEEISRILPAAKTYSLSGTQIREDYLNKGRDLPEWFTRKEVATILNESYPPRHRQGICIWFTGLSGSGKSTTAEILAALLLEEGRQSTMLDGDVVRTHLSKGLGFSRDDRDTNVLRIGFVASEIVRHGGIVICAAVSPYRQSRNAVRMMLPGDKFYEVFVDTPLEICEERDTKGMYAKARRGELKGLTGVDDVYEVPERPERVLDTVGTTASQNARAIIDDLRRLGFLKQPTLDA